MKLFAEEITSNFTNPKIFSHLGHSIFYASFLRLIYPYWIKSIRINVWSAEIEIRLIGSHIFHNFFLALKKQTSCQFSILVDFFAIDFPNSFDRFSLIGILGSYTYKFRLYVSIPVRDGSIVPSLCYVFSSSQWFEREIWDMFGIFFINNFDLRRILTDYGFSGFPLRKDFPVSGFFELRYNESYKSIISEPVEYTQEYRVFDFTNSWK